MADITKAQLNNANAVQYGTKDVRMFQATDPVYFETDNLPLKHLMYRDSVLESVQNATVDVLNAARGSEADLNTRLSVSLNADGTIKTSAVPNVTALSNEIVAARGAYADLDTRLDAMDASEVALSLELDRTQLAANFEARAEAIRKITPSGFNDVGDESFGGHASLSSLKGLMTWDNEPNQIRISMKTPATADHAKVVVNGYTISLNKHGVSYSGVIQAMPAAPASGTRQDLAFLEVWKEEVSKTNGLFFAYGNTQYNSSASINGATLTQTPTYSAGSAYFAPSTGVYAVQASTAPAAFIANQDNNIGILENGNYSQIRYRIRVEANFSPSYSGNEYFMTAVSSGNSMKPQGQLASAPANDEYSTATGLFLAQNGINGWNKTVDDKGVYVGGFHTSSNNPLSPISGLSLDGYTYALPICAVHRRNTGVYSLANQNGTAFENAWVVTISNTAALSIGAIVTSNGSTFRVTQGRYRTGDFFGRAVLVRLTGATAPATSGTWANGAQSGTFSDIVVSTGAFSSFDGFPNDFGAFQYARPDSLYSDIIDRRDVLDLRHLVSLSGKAGIDKDSLFQQTQDLLMNGTYRQEWEQLKAYDNDGNGAGLITSGIYGNVLLESLGLGATVPDPSTNTNITKQLTMSNGNVIAFNGAHASFSDAETNENCTVYVQDQADGSASKTHCSENDLVSYNATTHALEFDLTQHSSYAANAAKDPTFLAGHAPDIRWGNGAKVAGVLNRNSDYNWVFQIKEFGAIYGSVLQVADFGVGSIYEDVNGNQWSLLIDSGAEKIWIPVYSDHNGSVLPGLNTTLTRISSVSGPAIATTHTGVAWGHILSDFSSPAVGYSQSETKGWAPPIGYSLAAHGTGANEAIFATFKINYKAGSSCLPQLPYGDSAFKGADLFINGVATPIGRNSRPMLSVNSATKTVGLTGLVDAKNSVFKSAYQTMAPSVLIEGSTHYMWYNADLGGAHPSAIGHASSTDNGLTWTDHGIVLTATATAGLESAAYLVGDPCVIKEGSTYKMIFMGHNGGRLQLMLATSTDRINWTYTVGPMTGGAVLYEGFHTSQPCVIKVGSVYHLWCRANYNHIRYYTSNDLLTWTYVGVALQDGSNGYTTYERPSVIKDGSVFKMIVSAASSSRIYAVPAYFISSNGSNWVSKGDVITGVTGDSDLTNIHFSALVKNGATYELYYTRWNNFDICRGILAMSQPGATGSSLTGVYTNSNPQINLGFKSTDTVVLHYERDVKCVKSLYGTVDWIEFKEAIISSIATANKDTTGLTKWLEFNEKYALAYIGEGRYVGGSDLLTLCGELILNNATTVSEKQILLNLQKILGGRSTVTNINFTDSAVANTCLTNDDGRGGYATPTMQQIFSDLNGVLLFNNNGAQNAVTANATALGVCSVRGAVKLYLATMHGSFPSNAWSLTYLLGHRTGSIDLIGRPLVK